MKKSSTSSAKQRISITLGIFLAFALALGPCCTLTNAFAEVNDTDDAFENEMLLTEDYVTIAASVQETIFAADDAYLQNYNLEDLKATQSFILSRPYEGSGRVIDAYEDGRIDCFDMVMLRRGYMETGNFFDLACKMFSDTSYETISEGTVLFSENETINNRIIVKGYTSLDFSGLQFTQLLHGPNNLYFVEFENSIDTENALEALSTNPLVMYAEKDTVIDVSDEVALDVESEINANSYSWGVSAIEADQFSDFVSKNSNSSVKVAVIDTGVDLRHPFLKDRLLSNGKDFGDGDNDPSPYVYIGDEYVATVSHGTHVSGIIADCTRNTNISILPIKVLDNNLTLSTSGIISALYYARDNGCSVINCSFGTTIGIDEVQDQVMREVINSGVSIVASAGNDRKRALLYPLDYSASTDNKSPAHMSECIVVAALDSNLNYAPYSCYGSSIDVAAPGDAIFSTYPRQYKSGYGYMSGTSMAAPHISASAALIKALNPSYSPAQIEKTLTSTCQDLGKAGFDTDYGYGIPKLSRLIKAQIPPSISLSSKTASLYKGQKFTLSASVTPGDVYINWTTSNSSVATVSNGIVTANGEGTATITAFFTNNGTTYSATCSITVKKPGITLSQSSKTVYQTDTFTLTTDTVPSGRTIFWSSSNGSVATVSNGVVTANEPGTATITASFTFEGETYSASCNVTVKEVSVSLDQVSKTVYQTDEFTLKANVNPSNQTVKWTSSNSSVATVSDGKVIAVNPGTANITASIVYGGKTFSAVCTVTVKKVSIELNVHNKSIIIGDSFSITATTSPNGLNVEWDSSNNMIASVNSGKISSKAAGNITVTATIVYNGKEFADICKVAVVEPSVKISTSQVKISKNETFQLKAETLPENQTITWTSEDTDICTIDSKGIITGKAIGNTMVYASITYAGKTYTSSCNVIIGEPKVSLNKSSMTMYIGDTQSLIASVIAVDGIDISSETKSDIEWTSSNKSVATVDSNGAVKGVSKGNATITAKYTFCGITYSATCNVTVEGKPTISLNKSSLTMYIGDTSTLTASVTPTNSTVSWSSSNTSIATVSNGKISAISNGTATITASFRYNGVNYSTTCSVTVSKPSITFDSTSKTLYQGESFTINATLKPSGPTVSWSSSNTSVATVSSSGKVTGKNTGTATITGKFTYGGNTYSATCKVTVSSISMSLSSYTGSATVNVWDDSLWSNSDLGIVDQLAHKVALPNVSYSPTGASYKWTIVSGNGWIGGNQNLYVSKSGTVTARCTLSYNGYTAYKDYKFTLQWYKTTTALNYFYKTSNNPYNSNNNRYNFNVPTNTTVYISEVALNGTAGESGATLYGRTTYNGYDGWIIISAW